MSKSIIAVSAPGKVLFTGGFLVLDRNHTGLVLGLDARIHVSISTWAQSEHSIDQGFPVRVLVQSPQFLDARWLYEITTSPSDLPSIEQITE